MLRLACALAIAAQLVLIALFVRPSGATAIAFSFVGHPLFAAAVGIGLLWWRAHRRGRNGARTRRSEAAAGSAAGPRRRGPG